MIRLFGRSKPTTMTMKAVEISAGHGEVVSVVGESQYQDAIRDAIKDITAGREGRRPITAVLMREPDNTHDRNAVAVYLEGGAKAGYLSREDAVTYKPAMDALAKKKRVAACSAFVVGGTEDKPSYGVILSIAPPEQLLAEATS